MTSSALPSAAAADGNSPGSETAESINPSKDDDNDVAKIKTLIQTLISITPTSFEDEQSRYPTVPSAREARRRQWRICREVLHLLTKQHSDSRWVCHWSPDESEPRREKHGDSAENSFIRTSLKDYNKKRNIAQTPFSNKSDEFHTPQQESTDNGCDNTESGGNNKTNANSYNGNANQTIREALGDLPSATTSQLATVLTKLLTQRIETSEILPDTQDSVANWEALGFLSDPGAVDTAANPNANASATNNAKQMQSATKTAMTLTPLSLTASRLYADLLGRHGAWGAGLVDIGGLSSISALVRRWCVECRGREPGGRAASRGSRNTTSGKSTDDGVSGHVAKRARSKIINNNSKKDRDGKQPTRRSARINSSVSFMDCDHDDDYDDDCEEENAADNISTVENSSTDPTLGTSQYNFQLDEDESDEDNGNSRYKDKFTNESQMILSGVRLAKSLSMPPLQPDYCNWSSEAKESYVEAASVALATSSALLVKAKNCVLTASTKNHDGVVNAGNGRRSRARMVDVSNEYEKEIIKKVVEECEFAVASLERALCATIRIQSGQGKKSASTTPTLSSSVVVRSSERIAAKKAQSPQEEDLEIKKKTKESGIFLLRGILPMLTMKMELPNGQVGKQAAYLTVSNLVVKIIQTVVAEKEKIAALKSRLLRISSRSAVKVDKGNNSSMTPRADHNNHHSQTPKRGGRKSISFSFTPGKATTKQNQAHSPLPTLLQPPSLKKSITPKRTRFSPSTISPANKQLQYDLLQQQQHPILTLLIGMLHKLFTSKGLERAESRSRVCSLGILCLEHFPSRERGQLLCFVSNMCQSRVSSHRLLGVELIGEVLCQDWFWKDEGNYQLKKTSEGAAEVSSLNLNSSLVHLALGNGVENDNIATTSILLFSSLHSRLTDKLPAVRTRTAMSFVGVLQKSNVNSVMGLNIQTSSEFNQDKESDDAFIGKSLTTTLCKIGPSLVHSLRNRARNDDKATVRRACIVAWLEMLSLAHREDQGFGISGLDISALCTLCNDPSVATRKAAAEALTKLVIDTYDRDEYSSQASALEFAWAHTVLPLVSDAEVSCVSKAMEFFSKLIVDPIVDLAQDAAAKLSSGGNSRYYVAWRILSKLSDGGNEAGASRSGIGSLQTAIQKLFINAGDDCKTLTKNLLRAVYKIGILSLGIDNHASQHDLSTPNKGEFGEDFFERDMAAMRTGAWYILEALTNCLVDSNEARTAANISLKQAVRSSAIDCSYVVLSLKKLKELGNSVDISPSNKATLAATSRNCLKVISKIGGLVPLEDAKKCSSDLMQDLKSFSLPNDLMPSTISALVAFTKRICNDSGKDIIDECDEWINSLLDRCEYAIESWLSRFSRHGCIEIDDERLLTRILFCIGELTMVGFSSQQDTSQLRTKSSRDLVTDKDPVRGLFVRPSNRLVHLVKLMLPTTMPIPSVNEEDVTPTPSCVRAYAFVTLGKLCLRDESLAKDCLNILARELHHGSNSDPAVQSNALMVMGDLCVRYTNLVDRYLPFMAACLQAGNKACRKVVTDVNLSVDPSAIKVRNYSLVKKNAILLLSSLVLQDYIKWRGLFIHRFLAAVADEDDEVSCLARTALRGPLLEKQPNLLSNNFVEAIFVFNSCKAHPIYCAAAASGENGTGVAVDFDGTMLCGKEGYHKRFEVYRMMLTNMNDQQKLEVTVRLAKVVLGGALETNGDLSAVCKVPPQAIHPNEEDYYAKKVGTKRLESAMHVLTDTFAILKCSQIKMGHKSSVDPDQDEDALEQTGVKVDQRNLYKTSLLTKISCKHLMETIIPILCNLKTVLESSRSPFLKDLMHYLGYIFRSFKAEVKEHLAGDPTLLQELEYDFRKYRQRETSSGQDMKNSEDNVRISE